MLIEINKVKVNERIRKDFGDIQELAEDIMKILTCYSARYYGARGGRKKKIKVENEPVEFNEI